MAHTHSQRYSATPYDAPNRRKKSSQRRRPVESDDTDFDSDVRPGRTRRFGPPPPSNDDEDEDPQDDQDEDNQLDNTGDQPMTSSEPQPMGGRGQVDNEGTINNAGNLAQHVRDIRTLQGRRKRGTAKYHLPAGLLQRARVLARTVNPFTNLAFAFAVAAQYGAYGNESNELPRLGQDIVAAINSFENDQYTEFTVGEKVHYVRVYQQIIDFIPQLKEEVRGAGDYFVAEAIISEVQKAASSARSSDCHLVKTSIAEYILFNPQKTLEPKISRNAKSDRGFNHLILARALCPIDSLLEFDANPEDFCEDVRSGGIKLNGPGDFSAFMWEGENYESFDSSNPLSGFCRGHLLFRVGRALLTGPTSALKLLASQDAWGNAKKHGITRISPNIIACVMIHCHIGLSAMDGWSSTDGGLNLSKRYQTLLDTFEDNDEWAHDTLSEWNREVLGNSTISTTTPRKNPSVAERMKELQRVRREAAAAATALVGASG